ncbi:MAG: tetratricopeptide repeat protein [Bacteriovoracia bacterium]
MKQLFTLCAIALLLASCATGGSKLKEKQSDIYFSAGVESLQRGDYTDALRALKESVKLNPKSAEGWSNLGLAYAGKKEFARAESSWKKTLDVDSSFTDAHLNLGALYMEQKRYPLAEQELRAAMKDLTYGKSSQVKFNLGLLYSKQGKNLLAQQYFKLAVKEDDGFCPAWFQLAQIQKSQDNLDEAASSYKKSLTGPCFNNPRAHYELGEIYLKAKEPALAKSKLLEIIQFFPSTDWARKAEITLNTIR